MLEEFDTNKPLKVVAAARKRVRYVALADARSWGVMDIATGEGAMPACYLTPVLDDSHDLNIQQHNTFTSTCFAYW